MAARLEACLARIPRDLDLVDADPAVIARGSAAWDFWEVAREIDEVGPVTRSKLLAAKRPRLIPVQDSVVSGHLSWPGSFWAALHDELKAGLHEVLLDVGERAQLARGVSPLRVFDVVLWMRNAPDTGFS